MSTRDPFKVTLDRGGRVLDGTQDEIKSNGQRDQKRTERNQDGSDIEKERMHDVVPDLAVFKVRHEVGIQLPLNEIVDGRG